MCQPCGTTRLWLWPHLLHCEQDLLTQGPRALTGSQLGLGGAMKLGEKELVSSFSQPLTEAWHSPQGATEASAVSMMLPPGQGTDVFSVLTTSFWLVFLFFGCPVAYGVSRSGIRSELQFLTYAVAMVTLYTLIHCTGQGFEPESPPCRDAAYPVNSTNWNSKNYLN